MKEGFYVTLATARLQERDHWVYLYRGKGQTGDSRCLRSHTPTHILDRTTEAKNRPTKFEAVGPAKLGQRSLGRGYVSLCI